MSLIGPNPCDFCGGEYGAHTIDDCPNDPENKPFEPTMNLRYNTGCLEQEFVRPDGEREWRGVPHV